MQHPTHQNLLQHQQQKKAKLNSVLSQAVTGAHVAAMLPQHHRSLSHWLSSCEIGKAAPAANSRV
jgi:hypothetical protein